MPSLENSPKGRASAALNRNQFIALLQAALNARQARFARQAAAQWLQIYSGDLHVQLLSAQAILQDENAAALVQDAVKMLEALCLKDPEFAEAHSLLFHAYRVTDSPKLGIARGNYLALTGKTLTVPNASNMNEHPVREQDVHEIRIQEWGQALWEARQYIHQEDFARADGRLRQAFGEELRTHTEEMKGLAPLVALTQIENTYFQGLKQADGDRVALRSLAELYSQQWQDCLPFVLIYADSLMDGGESDRAVALLHQAAAQDIGGQVAARLWGAQHPYRSLWYDAVSAQLDIAVPASVAAVLGWNQLPEPASPVGQPLADTPPASSGTGSVPPANQQDVQEQPVSKQEVREQDVRDIYNELERIAANLKQPHLARIDGRFPIYVILSVKQGLINQYGAEGFTNIDAALQKLVTAISNRQGWKACLLYADDPQSAAALGIKPAPPKDPWRIKLSLADLDSILGARGEMIGALLIVGGAEIVPFHKLPNPVDDPDVDVPSDNPYGGRDENYFAPEWAVGRISTGASKDAHALIQMIEAICDRHTASPKEKPWFMSLLQEILRILFPSPDLPKDSMGYTAAVWREASQNVFKPIGAAEDILVSPPFTTLSFSNGSLLPGKLSYFNLHGVEDGADWYGQRDPTKKSSAVAGEEHAVSEEDYPIALTPQNLRNKETVPGFVFTEACYGAHISGKTIEQALALKFLDLGTQALVGSTCTAYGSVTDPLTAADILARAYWQNLSSGLSAGEALRKAKVDLASEMADKQGYLDGEDQKTLIQFVLYGDPLAVVEAPSQKRKSSAKQAALRAFRPREIQQVKTVQEQPNEVTPNALTPETLEAVREVVAKYLPGMTDARMSLSHFFPELPEQPSKNGSSGLRRDKPAPKHYAADYLPRQVITLRKQVQSKSITHEHIARLTIDDQGEIVKMAVSR